MTSTEIKKKAQSLGYVKCAIIPTTAMDGCSQRYEERIAAYPESEKIYDEFRHLTKALPEGKSIIVASRAFDKYKTPKRLKRNIGRIYLLDGRLPFTKEHRRMLEFESYLAAIGAKPLKGGVLARWVAFKSGVGVFGYNNFIYDKKHGSSIWVDAFIVEGELDYDKNPKTPYLKTCSDKCKKCVKACPTKALSDKFSMDIKRCIAHMMFDKNPQDEGTLTAMGTWIYGCDICQDVCPKNREVKTGNEEFPLLHEHNKILSLEQILEMDEDYYKRVFNPLFWYAGEENQWIWKRNVLRAMINSNDKKYHPYIIKYSAHEDERIRCVAEWGIKKLSLIA